MLVSTAPSSIATMIDDHKPSLGRVYAVDYVAGTYLEFTADAARSLVEQLSARLIDEGDMPDQSLGVLTAVAALARMADELAADVEFDHGPAISARLRAIVAALGYIVEPVAPRHELDMARAERRYRDARMAEGGAR